jgi:hypothetical protein
MLALNNRDQALASGAKEDTGGDDHHYCALNFVALIGKLIEFSNVQKHKPRPVQCGDLTEAIYTTTLMLIPAGRSLFNSSFPARAGS